MSGAAVEVRSDSRRGLNISAMTLCAALVLWGFLNGLAVPAIAMALPLLVADRVGWRWALGTKDFNRVCDLSSVGFVVLAVYLFDAYSVGGVYQLLRWLPVALFLPLLVQVYSTRERLSYSALFWSVRRAERRGSIADGGTLDFRVPYLVICLAAAGASPASGKWFGVGLGVVLAGLLWSNRPRRYPAAVWAGVLVVGLAGAWVAQAGVKEVRRMVEPMLASYFQDRIWKYRDPYSAFTSIGQIGRLKTSERIVMRVRSAMPGGEVPTLLREAVYQVFSRNLWLGERGRFATLEPDVSGERWPVRTPPEKETAATPGRGLKEVDISTYLRSGKGLVPVPAGTYELDYLPVKDVYLNHIGVLKVLEGPPLVDFKARFTDDGSDDGLPRPIDETIPLGSERAVQRSRRRAGARGLPAEQAVARVRRFFGEGFRYTLDLVGPKPGANALEAFVRDHRSGHCEYYATASVMLLRAAGVPARYAVGYSVQEWSEVEQAYVVRRRHAHSWALAHVDGRWIDVDTTPAVWGALEDDAAPWWQPGFDLFAWAKYRFSRWRYLGEESDSTGLLWLLAPLIVVLVWRLSRNERVSRDSGPAPVELELQRPGLDSSLYRVVEALESRGFERRPSTTLREWLEDLRARDALPGSDLLLGTLVPLHYRLRFDPASLSEVERANLEQGVKRWLGEWV